VDEEEELTPEEETEIRGSVLPPASQIVLFDKAMELEDVDKVEGILSRDFKVANLPREQLTQVQFLLQCAKIIKLHAEQYNLNLNRLIRQIRADAYIIAGTSPGERGKLLELLATMRKEVKMERKIEKPKSKWVPL
jgi:hypothetical protein